MSAYIVSKAHISAILRAAAARRAPLHDGHQQRDPMWWKHDYLREDRLDEVGRMLLGQCVASVHYRYEDEAPEDLPSPCDNEWLTPYEYIPVGRMPTPVEALKLLACYEYQSCENPGWPQTEAHEFCQALRNHLVRELPGYEEASWDWNRVTFV